MTNKTILKWAGSKIRIMEQLRPHLPKTKRLVEPFAGSCAVMMNTDYEQYLIADVNADLINMYLCAFADADSFINDSKWLFSDGNIDEKYKELRDEFNGRDIDLPCFRTAALFLFLNKHGFNGLCRYNKKGLFNVPFGYYKNTYFPEDEIRAFSAKSQKVDIRCRGWADTLLRVCAGDGIYCDPPYMGTGFTQYHTAGFGDGDQVALARTLQVINASKGIPVTVSNSIDAKELYADLGFIIHEIEAPRSISANGNRKPVTEIIATLGAWQ